MPFKPTYPLVASLVLLTILPSPSFAEPLQRRQVPLPDQATQEEQERTRTEKEMEKKANQERQAELKRDADKLFQLATELKQYVDKGNENVLSLDVLKKAEAIEKLAHSVKEKMKGP